MDQERIVEYAERVLGRLARRDYQPLKMRALARELGVPDKAVEDFRAAVETLMQAGHIGHGRGKSLVLTRQRPGAAPSPDIPESAPATDPAEPAPPSGATARPPVAPPDGNVSRTRRRLQRAGMRRDGEASRSGGLDIAALERELAAEAAAESAAEAAAEPPSPASSPDPDRGPADAATPAPSPALGAGETESLPPVTREGGRGAESADPDGDHAASATPSAAPGTGEGKAAPPKPASPRAVRRAAKLALLKAEKEARILARKAKADAVGDADPTETAAPAPGAGEAASADPALKLAAEVAAVVEAEAAATAAERAAQRERRRAERKARRAEKRAKAGADVPPSPAPGAGETRTPPSPELGAGEVDPADAPDADGQSDTATPDAEEVVLAPGEIIGTLSVNRRGFGWLAPRRQAGRSSATGDIFVPAEDLAGGSHGDTVVFRIRPRTNPDIRAKKPHRGQAGPPGERRGVVVRVVKRGRNRLVGTLLEGAGTPMVRPDGDTPSPDIACPDARAAGARPGQKVVVERLPDPANGAPAAPRGVIVEVIGSPGEPGVDALSILRQFDIPDAFPPECLDEARTAAARLGETDPGREDCRHRTIITIDPGTARDFDDAVELTPLPGGGWELGVHVADVSHFVTPGSALDAEARLRGNSVYLPRRVVPMLPELLSNGVCSLQEAQDRFCLSAFVTLDRQAEPVAARFARTVIRSVRRFTYEQAFEILQGRDDIAAPDVTALVRAMGKAAEALLARRRRNGLLELHLPKVELLYDEQTGRVIDARPESHDFSHRLIEMFMLEANEAVARHLARRGRPTLRRVHEAPAIESELTLRRFLKGLDIRMPESPTHADLQGVLRAAAGSPKEFAVHLAVLKSMRRATYSPEEEGHFALAAPHYVHFTSPIRRYPDLVVHRDLAAEIRAGRDRDDGSAPARPETPKFVRRSKLSQGAGPATERAFGRSAKVRHSDGGPVRVNRGEDDEAGGEVVAALADQARHCSFTERRAEDAEREYRSVKIAELLSERVGEELDAVITGMGGAGLFVQCGKYLAEGVVPVTALPFDRWRVSQDGGSLVGLRTKRTFHIGDPVRVRIAAVDVARRRVELAWRPSEEELAKRGKGRRFRPEEHDTRRSRSDDAGAPARRGEGDTAAAGPDRAGPSREDGPREEHRPRGRSGSGAPAGPGTASPGDRKRKGRPGGKPAKPAGRKRRG